MYNYLFLFVQLSSLHFFLSLLPYCIFILPFIYKNSILFLSYFCANLQTIIILQLLNIIPPYSGQLFSQPSKLPPPPLDSQNRYFLDRDGQLFRFIVDYMRTQMLILPEKLVKYFIVFY